MNFDVHDLYRILLGGKYKLKHIHGVISYYCDVFTVPVHIDSPGAPIVLEYFNESK